MTSSWLTSRHASWLTHGSIAGLTIALFALLVWAPLAVAIVPCALIHYRIVILLHDYLHGTPFRRYRDNLRLLSLYEALLITFGFYEVFRGIHLAHHRWLNTPEDPVWEDESARPRRGLASRLYAIVESSHYMVYIVQSARGRHPYVKFHRVLLNAGLSAAAIVFWVYVAAMPRVPLLLMALALYSGTIPSSLRGAVEHHSAPDDPRFANEYRVWLPLFNLNRHIHHHLEPRLPWYQLAFVTPEPLPAHCYWTHWVHTFIKRDFVFMRPMSTAQAAVSRPETPALPGQPAAVVSPDPRPGGDAVHEDIE